MAIERRKCQLCSAEYYGSKNKTTCSNACKQKIYRLRKSREKALKDMENADRASN